MTTVRQRQTQGPQGPKRPKRGRPASPAVPVSQEIRCTPEEVEALQRLAASQTAGIWRVKRAKIILQTLEGLDPERLMWSVRVPIKSVVRFQATFAKLRMAAFDQPPRKPTAREAAVERMLELLESPPPGRSPLWKTTTVHYLGRDYTLREIARIRSFVQKGSGRIRVELARELCEVFGLRQATGRLRTGTAVMVLKRMSMDNIVMLPAPPPRIPRVARSARDRQGSLEMEAPTAEVETKYLSLVLVQGPLQSRVWREALQRHHYLEQHRLYGAQLRYLVFGSNAPPGPEGQRGPSEAPPQAESRSLLAVLSFSSAAWRLTARDEFVGWTDEQRIRNLHLVACNSRFLILPWVKVKCLASRILGAAVRRLPLDWEARYGHRLVLLETFVQLDRFSGTCYRAANWQNVGTTRGYSVRGHEARTSEPPRAIFLYPLRKDFRAKLTG